MNGLKDIWNEGDPDQLSEDRLLAYLEGRLSPGEAHEVELLLGADNMGSDAWDGLQDLGAETTRRVAGRLNRGLKRRLARRTGRHGRKSPVQNWAWIAALLVLILAVLGYLLIRWSIR